MRADCGNSLHDWDYLVFPQFSKMLKISSPSMVKPVTVFPSMMVLPVFESMMPGMIAAP